MSNACFRKNPSCSLFVIFLFFFLTACGGGGGDDAPSTAVPTSLSYTGLTSRAVISESNAVDMASGAVNGGISGTVFNRFASLTRSTDAIETKRRNVFFNAVIMQNAIMDLQADSAFPIPASALYTEQETIDGACGGHAFGNFQVDDINGSFLGDLAFAGYCESAVTLNGDAVFSGTINLAVNAIETVRLDFDYLRITDPTESYLLDGSIAITNRAESFTITMNMVLQEGMADDVFRVDDYAMVVVDYQSYLSMTVSGNFYDPDYGYVSVSTPQDLIVDDFDRTPSAGMLIAIGENGSAGGPTMAKLTCYPSGLFQVEADTDGDGDYDWDSGYLSWDDY